MPDKVSRSRARKPKARTGCSVCKRRRLKCDEQQPSCRRCIKIGVECPGYALPIKWSTKYEKTIAPSQDLLLDESSWFHTEARRLSTVIRPDLDHMSPHEPRTEHTDTPDAIVVTGSSLHSASDKSACSEVSISPRLDPDDGEQGFNITNSLADEFGMSPISPGDNSMIEVVDIPQTPGDCADRLEYYPADNSISLTYYTPQEESSLLLNHYFSTVCQINSAFDSLHNPFRSEVSRMIIDSPLLFYCIMSMSAAHLYQGDQQKSDIPLQFQTKAISQLSSKLSEIETTTQTETSGDANNSETLIKRRDSSIKDDVLLGIIVLGMTSTWHDASATGLSHLSGSRYLFKRWMASNGLEDTQTQASMSGLQSFLVSSMVYWEAMSSFLLDQDCDATSYLETFCNQSHPSIVHPNPWTGVATPVFVFLAKTGTILRNNKALRRLRLFKTGEQHVAALYSELLQKAAILEQEIVKFRFPLVGLIEDTGDLCTPPNHFLSVARCYRLAALLELYREFPELLSNQVSEFSSGQHQDPAHSLLSLAFGILGILEGIPDSSGTIIIQMMALLIAGSALNYITSETLSRNTLDSLNKEVTKWRNFVRQRILHLFVVVGLRSVNHAILILDEVWARMDISMSSGSEGTNAGGIFTPQTHWLDVMTEKKLETIFG